MHVIELSDTAPKPDDFVIVGDKYRFAKPYHFDYLCSVKQRWEGRTIIDIFTQEFPAKDKEYYLKALASGHLRVEGQAVDATTPLKNGFRMRHLVHRHEPPVSASPIQVVGITSDFVAVCKPSGIPVHVSGQYRKNTVLGILTAERLDLGKLLPVHRLDKPVSGVLLFARHGPAANEMRQRIEAHKVEKVYVARVQGVFPLSSSGSEAEPIRIEAALDWDPVTNMAFVVPPSEFEAEGEESKIISEQSEEKEEEQQQHQQPSIAVAVNDDGNVVHEEVLPPIEINTKGWKKRKRVEKALRSQARAAKLAAEKLANGTANGGRPAVTLVRRLSVAPDGKSSVVECRPLTGRTHQIRVHLAHSGFPIGNDRQYGGIFEGPASTRQLGRELGIEWGQDYTKNDANNTQEQPSLATDTESNGGRKLTRQIKQSQNGVVGGLTLTSELCGLYQSFPGCGDLRVGESERDPLCSHCPGLGLNDYPVDLRPLWLHARSYSWKDAPKERTDHDNGDGGGDVNDGERFEAPLPYWAEAEWVPPPPPPPSVNQ